MDCYDDEISFTPLDNIKAVLSPSNLVANQFSNSDTYDYKKVACVAIFGAFISQFTNLVPTFCKIAFNLAYKTFAFFKKLMIPVKSEIILKSIAIKNHSGACNSMSQDYEAVIHILNKKNMDIKRMISCIPYISSFGQYSSHNNNNDDDNKKTRYNIEIIDPICISKKNDIWINTTNNASIIKNKNTMNDDILSNTEITNIHLYSNKISVSDLKNKINLWTEKYEKHKRIYKEDATINYYYLTSCKNSDGGIGSMRSVSQRNNSNMNVYKMIDDDQIDPNLDLDLFGSNDVKWVVNKFVSFKTFNNIYFDRKKEVFDRLNYFLENKHEYMRKGIPYTLGFMFHGNPGCGKTSCIKAMANHTKRHIIELNLKNIKTCNQFITYFTSEFINNKFIPMDKRIIIIEDIDCMLDVVKQRSESDLNIETMLEMNNLNTDDINRIKLLSQIKSASSNNNTEKLSLSCILNTLDGVLEQDGRIIIISTNYINKLDKAFLRPGRFDMKVEFTLCSSNMVYDIMDNFYNTKIDRSIILPDKHISPADLVELCFNNQYDYESVINSLKS